MHDLLLLAQPLVHEDSGCLRHVERRHLPLLGKFHREVAVLEHKTRHALAFRAHDERDFAFEVRLPHHFLRMLARRANPEALFLQAFDRLGEVRDLRHVDVGNRACRAFVRRRRYVRRALVGNDDAGSPNRLGGAGDGTQVARVGDVVEDDDECRAAVFGSLREYAKDKVVFLISHRLYHFPQLRKIIFMEDGKTVVGTHDELMADVPAYRHLYESQTGGKQHEEK